MKRTFPFLLVIASGVALAGGDGQDKLNQLEAVLNGVRQEQQAVYQNYQMAKELRLMEVQEGTPPRSRTRAAPASTRLRRITKMSSARRWSANCASSNTPKT